MKSAEIMVGYRDQILPIKLATALWPVRYGVRPIVRKFGTLDPPHYCSRNWDRHVSRVEEEESMARIGISFGGGVQARTMIEHPEKVTCATFIASVLNLEDIDPVKAEEKYQMLNYSLPVFDTATLPADKIMTVASYSDQLMRPEAVAIDGARNILTPGRNHAMAIMAALTLRAGAITDFIKEH